MNYLIIIMLVVAMSLCMGCLVASLIMGELLITLIFMAVLTMLCIEIHNETQRSN